MNYSPEKKGVLIVEDEYAIRVLFCRFLEQNGYRAEPAADGREAMEILARRERRIDVVLLDCHMPGMSGMDLAEYVKQRHPRLPVVGISALAPFLGDTAGIFDAFLQKPALLKNVLFTLERALNDKDR